MTRDEVVALVGTRFGGIEDQADRIVAELQVCQNYYEGRDPRPWFLITYYDATLTTSGYMTLPADFLEQVEEEHGGFVWVDRRQDGVLVQLKRRPRSTFDPSCPDAPAYYDVVGDRVWFDPPPTEEFTAQLVYYKRDDGLSVNVENGWLREAPLLFVNNACVAVAQYNGEDGRIPVFAQLEAVQWKTLSDRIYARREANLVQRFGGDTSA